MNFFQLILKQMRQRALSTWLTTLSVVLGVGLAAAVLIVYRGGGALFGQTEFGFDVLVGPPKGSPTQLVLNTIYHIDQSPGNIPYSVYEDLLNNRQDVRIAVPIAVGDTYQNHRIVATLPKLFGVGEDGQPLPPQQVLEYKRGQRYELAEGRVFHPEKFEAIIGSEVPARTGLKLGDKFQATHGMASPGRSSDVHAEQWTVVGVLKPTHTAADRVLFIPLTTFYCIAEHEQGLKAQAQMKAAAQRHEEAEHHRDEHDAQHTEHEDGEHEHAYHLREDGTIELELPREQWQLSAVLVKSRGSVQASSLLYYYKMIDLRALAVNPATVMREFFETFFKGTTMALLLVALLVSVVASVGILVSIYNSISARKREIAILRALGATRGRIVALICLEAALIGLWGGVGGLAVGHVLGAAGSTYLEHLVGEGIDWMTVGWQEWLYLLIVVVLAVLAGLAPALKAYRTPVAENLVAE